MPRATPCQCRTLLPGVVNREACPVHTAAPLSKCGRCPRMIPMGDLRVPTVDGMVHVGCADVRERMGLDRETTPLQRADEQRVGRRRGESLPVHLSRSAIARLRRRRG